MGFIYTDTVSGFSFHPYLPMAASSSGQRRFGVIDDSSEDFTLSGISMTLQCKITTSAVNICDSVLQVTMFVCVHSHVYFDTLVVYPMLLYNAWVISLMTVGGFLALWNVFFLLENNRIIWQSCVGDENCASVWSFSYYSAEENGAVIDSDKINDQTGNEKSCENHWLGHSM